jgi:hypothetical protein
MPDHTTTAEPQPPGSIDARRLQELEDRAEITDIVSRYGNGVRLGDPDLIISCFADDAVLDMGLGEGPISGRGTILEHYRHSAASPATRAIQTFDQKVASTPIMTNVLIDLDGDRAHCESMCLAIHTGFKDGEGKVIVRGTRNIDDLVRTPEGWKIQHRVHPAVWAFDVPGTPLGVSPA